MYNFNLLFEQLIYQEQWRRQGALEGATAPLRFCLHPHGVLYYFTDRIHLSI